MENPAGHKAAAEALRKQLVAWRRDFHMHPELRFQEHRTSGIIAEQLRQWGYEVQTGIATTGVVALLEGRTPGSVAMVRFDMDAIPIQEENKTDYASQNPGLMHACGHDGHMAIGLGVAKLMAQRRDQMAGTLKLVFQPAEEGAGGAKVMVQEGVLENPRPDVFLSMHVWNELPIGTVAAPSGPIMAAADEWSCLVLGKGGHGALPHQTVDPVVAAGHIVTAVQTIVSRNVSPLDMTVVTVGAIHGGDAFNVIPTQVEMIGTVRTFHPQTRDMVLRRLQEVVEGVAVACGATAELNTAPLTPAVINDANVAAVVREAAAMVVGQQNVSSDLRTTVSEDAAFFMQEIPGCYFLVGSANPGCGLTAPHHSPRFDFDEDALWVGVAVLMQALAYYLS